ncbi:uncharacterized protein BT62DRAFT_747189 [Guyanagaster necrorhizus]|uniref:Methyltransferase domain-containing protein n=1 Tax=Guyanagaster necrorhizus TaxID=856835 RepID=A0A9P7VWS5_9AGAR|nr:uncharacterized protein BT62DRAFT_747189 [Guyanagaster necrorhizus MCA 3950]KAG7447987.1 hypothetical protein BT62DRAFT_747189 [Guyanagaster necrorhizus MCA 3950]
MSRTITGTTEDVTPWELYPAPGDDASSWTGAPLTTPAAAPSAARSTGGNSSRPSSSSGRVFAGGFVHRHRSIGSKTVKPPVDMGNATSESKSHYSLSSDAAARSATLPHVLSASVTTKPASSVHHVNFPFYILPSEAAPRKPRLSDRENKFSTADRTVLEELRRSISTRDAQFVVKGGITKSWGADGVGSIGGRRHHPFNRDQVPYPRCYEKDILDLDIWETSVCYQICESNTWHVFEKPPSKALDIGCGTGAWILNCARSWKDCHFVGLDCVPLHPDLQRIGSSDLTQRITWTQANFLESLPFPNDEFDYVHIKRIALGVPEDKWDNLFEEIVRVMKPGGAFEMIEEDLFFPGHSPDEADDNCDPGLEPQTSEDRHHRPYSRRLSRSSLPARSPSADRFMSNAADLMLSGGTKAEDLSSLSTACPSLLATASTGGTGPNSPMTPPSASLPLPLVPVPGTTIAEDDREKRDTLSGTIIQVTDSHGTPKSISMSNKPSSIRFKQRLNRSLENLLDSSTFKYIPQSMQTESSVSLSSTETNSPRSGTRALRSPTSRNMASKSNVSSFLTMPELKAPANPRDHLLLQTIYNGMQASRFINLSPLSLLPNLLGIYFRDVRTHPPIMFAFPPLAAKQAQHEDHDSCSEHEHDSDPDEEARNAINPFPARPPPPPSDQRRGRSGATNNVLGEDRWISVQNLLHKTSKYVSLDNSKTAGLTPRSAKSKPMNKALSSDTPSVLPKKIPTNRLPNTKLHIDLRTLNLHVALRTAEILGCSEAMWEWVLESQREARRKRRDSDAASKKRSRSVDAIRHLREATVEQDPNDPKAMIEDMTREEFEALLVRFHMCVNLPLLKPVSHCMLF